MPYRLSPHAISFNRMRYRLSPHAIHSTACGIACGVACGGMRRHAGTCRRMRAHAAVCFFFVRVNPGFDVIYGDFQSINAEMRPNHLLWGFWGRRTRIWGHQTSWVDLGRGCQSDTPPFWHHLPDFQSNLRSNSPVVRSFILNFITIIPSVSLVGGELTHLCFQCYF